jgi:hypothetical protein
LKNYGLETVDIAEIDLGNSIDFLTDSEYSDEDCDKSLKKIKDSSFEEESE